MTPARVISIPAPGPVRPLAPRASPRSAALPSLRRARAPSITSGLILAFIVLALLLQASFFAGLASGQAGAAPAAASPSQRVAGAR